MSSFHIRPLHGEDAQALASVHERGWQTAYRGLMPDDYLDGLTVEQRAAHWAEGLARPPRPRGTRLGAEDGGRVVGFIVAGPEDGDPAADLGEVYAINVDPDHWGRGVGQALLDAGCAHLRDVGSKEAILWVILNRTRFLWTPE